MWEKRWPSSQTIEGRGGGAALGARFFIVQPNCRREKANESSQLTIGLQAHAICRASAEVRLERALSKRAGRSGGGGQEQLSEGRRKWASEWAGGRASNKCAWLRLKCDSCSSNSIRWPAKRAACSPAVVWPAFALESRQLSRKRAEKRRGERRETRKRRPGDNCEQGLRNFCSPAGQWCHRWPPAESGRARSLDSWSGLALANGCGT